LSLVTAHDKVASMDAGTQPNQFTNVILPIISVAVALLGIVAAVVIGYWQVKTMERLASQDDDKARKARRKRRGFVSYLKDAWPMIVGIIPAIVSFLYEWTRPDGLITRWQAARLVLYGMFIVFGCVALIVISLLRLLLRAIDSQVHLVDRIADHLTATAADRAGVQEVIEEIIDIIKIDLATRKEAAEKYDRRKRRELID
jgi:uncharacterized membrane protein